MQVSVRSVRAGTATAFAVALARAPDQKRAADDPITGPRPKSPESKLWYFGSVKSELDRSVARPVAPKPRPIGSLRTSGAIRVWNWIRF